MLELLVLNNSKLNLGININKTIPLSNTTDKIITYVA